MVIDAVVVGAGPAGLAASAALRVRGVEHVVPEQTRVGAWRTQRDSFRLNTPGWMNQLLGDQALGAYMTGGEVVQRLGLAAHCPFARDAGGTADIGRRQLCPGDRRRRHPGPRRGRRHRRPQPSAGPGARSPAPRPDRPAPHRRLPRPRPAPGRGGAGRGQRSIRLPDHRGPVGRRPAGLPVDQPRGPRPSATGAARSTGWSRPASWTSGHATYPTPPSCSPPWRSWPRAAA